MGSDDKVWQRRSTEAASVAVSQVGLPRKKKGLPWSSAETQTCRFQNELEPFDVVVADRYLGIDDFVDQKVSFRTSLIQRGNRPIDPIGIITEDVEQHTRINDRHPTLV